MNRNQVIITASIFIVLAVLGIIFFLYTNAPVADVAQQPSSQYPSDSTYSGQGTITCQTGESVRLAFQNEVAQHNISNVKLNQTVVVGDYALQVWQSGDTGGEALLKCDNTDRRWSVVTSGGAAWSLGGLTAQGVPEDTAKILTEKSVQFAFQDEIAPYNDDNSKLHETVVAGDYALQVWYGDNIGGEALLKYDNASGRWIVISGGGGAWSLDGLLAQGVPKYVAEILFAGVPH